MTVDRTGVFDMAGRRDARRVIAAALALGLLAGGFAGGSAGPAQAASAAAASTAPAADLGPEPGGEPKPTTGPVTDLPLPRYVSLKATQANVRRGPGMTHRVDWVFMRRGMPLEVIAEYGHWRRVRDQEGGFGWVHYSMLSGVRTALVTPVEADLREEASAASPVVARAAPGVVLKVQACGHDWCEVYKDGVEGWLPKTALWGVSPEETFD